MQINPYIKIEVRDLKKIGILVIVLLISVMTVSAAEIKTTDSEGTETTSFFQGEQVFVTGSGFDNESNVSLYLVEQDFDFNDGVLLYQYSDINTSNVTVNSSGGIEVTLTYNDTMAGYYYIVADEDQDGIYNTSNNDNHTSLFKVLGMYPEDTSQVVPIPYGPATGPTHVIIDPEWQDFQDDPVIWIPWFPVDDAAWYNVTITFYNVTEEQWEPVDITFEMVNTTWYEFNITETYWYNTTLFNFTVDPLDMNNISVAPEYIFTWNISLENVSEVVNRDNKTLAIDPQVQHKDTNMTCLGGVKRMYNATSDKYYYVYDGCSHEGDAAWDHEHKGRQNEHDNWYCVRASVAMANSYYGGNLSQDRISYELFKDRLWPRAGYPAAWPEADLGHGRGTSYDDVKTALEFALPGATVTQTVNQTGGALNFSTLKNEIDNNRPVVFIIENRHAMIFTGYEVRNGTNFSRYIDPWVGRQITTLFTDLNITGSYVLSGDGIHATGDEDSIHKDTDGDGLVDFDEEERFKTDATKKDTDEDCGLEDKTEVRSYTFLKGGVWDKFDKRYPDPDKDNLRAELDANCDIDGTPYNETAVWDGTEDWNLTGYVDASETDNFNGSDDVLKVRTEKQDYVIGEQVKVKSAESKLWYYNEMHNYTVEPNNCGASYGSGTVDVDGNGLIENEVICIPTAVGTYNLSIDGNNDGDFDDPCDRSTTFQVDEGPPPIPEMLGGSLALVGIAAVVIVVASVLLFVRKKV